MPAVFNWAAGTRTQLPDHHFGLSYAVMQVSLASPASVSPLDARALGAVLLADRMIWRAQRAPGASSAVFRAVRGTLRPHPCGFLCDGWLA